MQDCTLDDALKAQGWLSFYLLGTGDCRRVLVDELGATAPQLFDIRSSGA